MCKVWNKNLKLTLDKSKIYNKRLRNKKLS